MKMQDFYSVPQRNSSKKSSANNGSSTKIVSPRVEGFISGLNSKINLEKNKMLHPCPLFPIKTTNDNIYYFPIISQLVAEKMIIVKNIVNEQKKEMIDMIISEGPVYVCSITGSVINASSKNLHIIEDEYGDTYVYFSD